MSQRTEHRRHQALDKYLADDKVEDICRHLACSKSWLYKWRNRYDATNATWAQERSTRPKSHPTQTPEHVEQAVVSLHLTLRHNGTSGAPPPSYRRSPSKGSSLCPHDALFTVFYAAITRR